MKGKKAPAARRPPNYADILNINAEALFILGVAVGIALHRGLMALVLAASPDNVCAYYEWFGRKKNRHKMTVPDYKIILAYRSWKIKQPAN